MMINEAMRRVLPVLSLGLLSVSDVQAADAGRAVQEVTAAGSQASIKGSNAWFTGDVRIDPLFSVNDAARFSGAYVTFEPGARTAWHTHPKGQRLIVTQSIGQTQEWGGPVVEIRAGDVVWCPPGIKHWHGATSKTAMTHIALTGSADGKNVEWMEKVGDEQFGK
jgi:quercetin dioxygenase-like cupin family protein